MGRGVHLKIRKHHENTHLRKDKLDVFLVSFFFLTHLPETKFWKCFLYSFFREKDLTTAMDESQHSADLRYLCSFRFQPKIAGKIDEKTDISCRLSNLFFQEKAPCKFRSRGGNRRLLSKARPAFFYSPGKLCGPRKRRFRLLLRIDEVIFGGYSEDLLRSVPEMY